MSASSLSFAAAHAVLDADGPLYVTQRRADLEMDLRVTEIHDRLANQFGWNWCPPPSLWRFDLLEDPVRRARIEFFDASERIRTWPT